MKTLISIVIPCYNEEKNIELLYDKLMKVLDKLNYNFEFLFVNDGSADYTWQKITALANTDKRVRGFNFSRNFGHQAALECGLKNAKGKAVISMDADLQHPPHIIPKLLYTWEQGFQIVNTKRLDHKEIGFFKKITSRLFYSFLNSISEVKITKGSSDFRLIDRTVLDHINELDEKDKFYRGIINWMGFSKTIVKFRAHNRIYGSSSYTLKKMMDFGRIGITNFSTLPIKIIFLFGLFLSILSFVIFILTLSYYFIRPGFFSSAIVIGSFIIFNNGILISIIGILSIYTANMHRQLQNRPVFIVKNEIK